MFASFYFHYFAYLAKIAKQTSEYWRFPNQKVLVCTVRSSERSLTTHHPPDENRPVERRSLAKVGIFLPATDEWFRLLRAAASGASSAAAVAGRSRRRRCERVVAA